ncbi:MAG: AI-2E family transporter [Candidatus Paceibacterota bacterium]|jgi:predicted PurR-regulated permease PerM
MADGKTLDISWASILKVGFGLFCFYLIYLVNDILTLVFFSLVISVLFNPAIAFLQKNKVPRSMAVAFVYLLFFIMIGGFIYSTAGTFLAEFLNLNEHLPVYFEKAAPFLKSLNLEQFQSFEVFQGYLQTLVISAPSNIFSAASTLFGGFFTMVTIFTISIFLSLEEKSVERFIYLVTPKNYENYIYSLFSNVQTKVAGWFATRVLTCVFVGIFTYLLLRAFDLHEGILTLSLFAAVTNIVPIVGPMVAGLFLGIFSLVELGWTAALMILAGFVLIQQIEGNILTPMLTKKFIGIPAVLVLVSLLIGARLWGMLGAILVIPMSGIVYEVVKEFLEKKKEEIRPVP